jgi:restriction endonuclease Mrr
VINEDRLGLDRVYAQAKRYARGNAVGRPEVQAFVPVFIAVDGAARRHWFAVSRSGGFVGLF